MNPNLNANQPSEGEQFLADFFDSVGIKYESEKRIDGLKNDTKQYRTADFYLPRYKVYVEFFGLWNNNGNGNEKYRHKRDVYRVNSIPCVYIYPENLGIIDYAFDKRLQMILEQYNLKKELRKYKLYKLRETREFSNRIGIIAVCILLQLLLLPTGRFSSIDWKIMSAFGMIVTYQVFHLYNLYMNIFKRNKHTLECL